MSGWKCPECGSGSFSLTTYERVQWSIEDSKMNLEEADGSTSLVGYQDDWLCNDCGWEGRSAPEWVDD